MFESAKMSLKERLQVKVLIKKRSLSLVSTQTNNNHNNDNTLCKISYNGREPSN